VEGNQRGRDRPAERLVWVDCEMTGLALDADALVEIAVLVTDARLNVLGDGLDLIVRPPDSALEQMDEYVRAMHTKSGLLDLLDNGTTLEEAQHEVMTYVRRWVPEARRAPMAGNTISTDRGFIARDLPALDQHLHYRVVDVSSVKELVKRWFPRAYFAAPAKAGGHRAMADILESIAELRYYREAVFVADPGPDTESARAIAARHVIPVGTIPPWANGPGSTVAPS
jgi:oligoribonuclease